MVFDYRWRAKTTPLIVKYIYKGNIHYLVENNGSNQICNKDTALKLRGGGGQRDVVKAHTVNVFGDPSLILIVWQ